MNQIEFINVWKKFKKGERFNSLRDVLPNLFRRALPLNNDNGLKQEEFWALRDVNFGVNKGEVIGIIGPNGAGKSTILKLLSRIMKPNKGEIRITGRLSALIEITAGFHPELTGRENTYLNGTILGMSKKEIDQKFDEIVDFSGIAEFIDTPVKRYSSGMYSRLGFSVAAHMDSDILLVDEVLSVGDIAFQAKCGQKMRELLKSGTTIILVSHNLSLIQSICKRVVLLNKGEILKEGSADEVIPHYQDIVHKESEEELKKNVSSACRVKINQEPQVKILNVSFFDGGYNLKENFNAGEPISMKVEYEVKKRVSNPIFALEIVRSDGVICCLFNTKDEGELINAIQTKGTISIDLGKINLAPGLYMTKISILDRDMINHYSIIRKDILKINSDGINTRNVVFLPKINWKME